MFKKVLLAAVAVFILWSVLDFVIHGLILGATYASTAQMWRPQGEMKTWLLYLVTFVAALAFAAIYGWLVTPKNTGTALRYGLIYGLGAGISMGYGSYAFMPIPYLMALVWFLGTVLEYTAGALLAATIIRE